MRKNRLLAWCAVALGVVGCTCPHGFVEMQEGGGDVDMVRTSYNAVDCLLQLMPWKSAPDPNRRLLVATVVDLNDYEDTSTFGRLTGEFLATRLSHHGYSVVHVTVRRGSIAINKEGQFLLSRDLQKLAEDYDTASVLVSTYTLAPGQVFMSLKLVNAEADTLVSAIDYAVPRGPQTEVLLGLADEHSVRRRSVYHRL